MIMQKTGILLILLNLFTNVHFVAAKPVETKCRIIVRVIESEDPRYKPSDGICLGDNTVFTGQVVLACSRSAGAAFEASSAAEAIKCRDEPKGRAAGGRGGDGKPFLLSPVGSSLSKPLTRLSWNKVLGADSYKVTLVGVRQYSQWEGFTQNTFLEVPKLNLETTIQVLVQAFYCKKLISSSQTTFSFLTPDEIKKLQNNIKLIPRFAASDSRVSARKRGH